TPTLPSLDGDVKGAVGPGTKVEGLFGKPIQPAPAAGDDHKVLTFRTDHWELDALPAPPAVPAPDDAVFKPALTFGLAPAPGASAKYARADPTHGTPPLPPLTGDVVGPLTGAVKVEGIQGTPVTAPNPATDAGKVLAYDGAKWAVEALPAMPTNVVTHPKGL